MRRKDSNSDKSKASTDSSVIVEGKQRLDVKTVRKENMFMGDSCQTP